MAFSQVVHDLRAARLRRSLSQAAVATRMGTTQSAVARLEASPSGGRLSTLERYASAVGVEIGIAETGGPSCAQTAQHIRASLDGEDVDDALRHVVQLLDDLAHADAATRSRALLEEPRVGDARWDALLAGVAEYACGLYGLAIPGWTAAPSRFLTTAWFVIEAVLGRWAPALAVSAFVDSPPQLANRGVFLHRASLVSA